MGELLVEDQLDEDYSQQADHICSFLLLPVAFIVSSGCRSDDHLEPATRQPLQSLSYLSTSLAAPGFLSPARCTSTTILLEM